MSKRVVNLPSPLCVARGGLIEGAIFTVVEESLLISANDGRDAGGEGDTAVVVLVPCGGIRSTRHVTRQRQEGLRCCRSRRDTTVSPVNPRTASEEEEEEEDTAGDGMDADGRSDAECGEANAKCNATSKEGTIATLKFN